MQSEQGAAVRRVVRQSCSTQTEPAEVASASPAPLALALAVPMLQAADMPLPPQSEQHVYSLCIEATDSNCVRGEVMLGAETEAGR